MVKKIFIGLVAVVAILAVIGLMLPRHVRVARSVTIDRPASMVYATVNSFVLFPQWSPWQHLDPNMRPDDGRRTRRCGRQIRLEGQRQGGIRDARLITASTPNQAVDSDLDFGDMGVAKSVMTLVPEGAMTRATWTVDVDMGANPIGHYIGLTMDSMLGKDFASGLGKLKTLVESLPNADIAGFNAEPVQLTAGPVLLVAEAAPADGIAKAYTDGYAQIGKFIAKNKLRMAGAPFGIDRDVSSGTFKFDAGIPVDRGDIAGADGVQVAQSYAGKALKTTHVGAYQDLPKAHQQLLAYMAVHGYKANGPVISSVRR